MPSGYKDIGNKQGGDPNIMKIKERSKVRPLDNQVAGWRQHGIEHPTDPEQFASVVCPGPRSCPLCRKPVRPDGKPRFPVSRRFASNVWDYDTSQVKVLVAGPQVFDEFKTAALVGIEPANCDWTIIKSGSGIGTKYDVIRHDADTFTATQITPDQLHDVAKYEMPASTEAIFEVLDNFGIDYDSLEIPSYTLEQALSFVMPYTKNKGMTIEQLLAAEQGFCEWLHGTKLEQGQLGDPVFLALQTAMEDRGLVPPLEDALAGLPVAEPAPAAAPQPTVNQAVSQPDIKDQPVEVTAGNGWVKLLSPIGIETTVPPDAADGLLAVGFTKVEPEPPEPATAADANAPMRVKIGGQVVEVPREQALMLINAGTAERVEGEVAEASEPEPPKLPLPDEVVQVEIGGAPVPMPYVQGKQVVDNPASGARFVDPHVQAAHEAANIRGQEADAASPSETPVSSAPSTEADPDKPFACDQCDAAYKTPGALTNHRNRKHGGAQQEPHPAAQAASNGAGYGSFRDRLKTKIASAPFARDYQRMVGMFQEVTGESNFMKMDDAQLAKLDAAMDAELAKAQAS